MKSRRDFIKTTAVANGIWMDVNKSRAPLKTPFDLLFLEKDKG